MIKLQTHITYYLKMNANNQISTINDIVRKIGLNTFFILKIILYDTTILLNRLPFGSWISIVYFISTLSSMKSVVEGGELYRIIKRAIHIYFIQQKSYNDCFAITQHYLWRTIVSQIHHLQSHTYQVVVYTWNTTSKSVKNEVKQFAKDLVLANADKIEQTIKEVAKTTVFSAIIIAISNKLVEELYPILLNTRAYSEQLRITNQNIHELSESITAIVNANNKCDLHLLENNSGINQKLEEISLQIEYLRSTQPTQFREIVNSLSIFASPSMTDVFAKLTGTIGSSASQQGRTRIDNM